MNFVVNSTSKGNQPKFTMNGWFYKEDYLGYESISEVLASELLYFIQGIDFLDYFLEEVEAEVPLEDGTGFETKTLYCCKSKIYTEGDFIAISKILSVFGDESKYNKYTGKELLDYVVDCVKDATGLDIRNYLRVLSYLDSILLNEDRHLTNICLIERDGVYREAPIFDNGLSLLADTNTFLMAGQTDIYMRNVKCKPFSTSFKKQTRYFDNKPLVIDIDGFKERLDLVDSNLDFYVPFKKDEYKRAKHVLLKRLRDTEGELWVKK